MKLNSSFISNIQDLYGEVGTVWLKNLDDQINSLCAKYGLQFHKALPDLTYNFVGLVEIIDKDESAIIKIAPPQQNVIIEAKWLQSFTHGVPKIYWIAEEQQAFLMQHLTPGKSLSSMVSTDDDQATRIISRTILDLQSHQQTQIVCKHLSELGKSFAVLKGRIDNKLLSQAVTWFEDMTQDRTKDVLLHGDLHHDNILSDGESWKVIDPHGYIGDPAFEVGPMIYNPGGDFFPKHRPIAQIIDRRLKILAEELPFDLQRIKAWTFCMTILSMAWTVEDHGYVPEFELAVANAINKMK